MRIGASLAASLAVLAVPSPRAARAEEPASATSTDDATAAPAPALDRGAPAKQAEPSFARQALALGGVGGAYVVLYGWTFMAWHYRAVEAEHIQFYDDGWFGADTYAGGADKLGHAWLNYALARGGARVLEANGWGRTASLVTGTTLAVGFSTLSEIKDGYNPNYGFSTNDVVANVAGAALGVAMELSPWLDERIDFRVQYFPSAAFIDGVERHGIFNSAEDYTGQTYYLAYHLASIDRLRTSPKLSWTRWVDFSVGYRSVAFKPHEEARSGRQDLFVGVTLNLQQAFDGGFLHFWTDVYQLPYTTLPLTVASRPQDVAPL